MPVQFQIGLNCSVNFYVIRSKPALLRTSLWSVCATPWGDLPRNHGGQQATVLWITSVNRSSSALAIYRPHLSRSQLILFKGTVCRIFLQPSLIHAVREKKNPLYLFLTIRRHPLPLWQFCCCFVGKCFGVWCELMVQAGICAHLSWNGKKIDQTFLWTAKINIFLEIETFIWSQQEPGLFVWRFKTPNRNE